MTMASLLSFSPLQAKASVAAPAETLDLKFGRKGIKFSESGAFPTVELTVRNGSSVKLDIPSGHITSYKPKVYWKDDGYEEVLYTLPPSSSAAARGGVALVVDELSSQPNSKITSSQWSVKDVDTDSIDALQVFLSLSLSLSKITSSQWSVKDVDADSIDALQVELSCSRGSLDITYVVSLYPLSMAAAVIVKNTGRRAVDLTTAILSHFKFKKRNGTGIQGLKGASYCTHPPPSSPFELLSPSQATKSEDPGLFSFGFEPENKPSVWSVQETPITVLRHKMSRVYAAPVEQRSDPFHTRPPSKYEVIDQEKELFFRVIRMGFEEIFVSSPGSYSEKYGKEYFICTGPASALVPIKLEPGEEWRGAQVIEHDNL